MQAQKKSIVGAWVIDPSKTIVTESSRDLNKEIIRDTLTMKELISFKPDVLLLDSVDFLDGKKFKMYSSNSNAQIVEDGTYSLSSKKFKWKKGDSMSKTKSISYLRKMKNAGYSFEEKGITFFYNVSVLEKDAGVEERGAINLNFKVFRKTRT